MPRADLVIAIRNGEHCVCAMNAASQKLEQIERRFVRPMHVFEYAHRLRPALQLIERCGKDYVAVRAGIDGRQQRALRLPRDVVQRGEGPGREERIARPPQYTRFARLLRQFLQQRGLADPRFAADERDTTTALRRSTEPFRQIGETSLTLK